MHATLTPPLKSLVHAPNTWTADNGNGTFSNPLFYDEFSDPDLIRVGEDYYLTGTTMHTFPGLPVLHSKDLVNWTFLSYACDKLDLGPDHRLEDGKSIYGQGFWAPSFRYHQGTFYIFSSVNGCRRTQVFRTTDPAGPWKHSEMDCFLHDLSLHFDDDGKIYVVWGYRDLRFAQVKNDLTGLVPGTEQTLFARDSLMGEGAHLYKINEKYYITGAWWDGRMRMPCARADKPEGPYELNAEISADEEFGIPEGYRLIRDREDDFQLLPADSRRVGRMALHQGGIVKTPNGEWWGFSMMDYNSVGRLTCLSPVTWQDGWPYFGLPGNLKRTPRTWFKPNTGHTAPPSAPYQRNDEFYGPKLANVWQWNHAPVDGKWSLAERPGFLRLHALPAPDFWMARNTLTQRAIGPESTPTAELDTSGLQVGDVAGLGLLNHPYSWIGVSRGKDGFEIQQFDRHTNRRAAVPFKGGTIWLRAHCDFLQDEAFFSYSTDGKHFEPLGGKVMLIYQGLTFQGVRYSLFNYNVGGAPGGFADFDRFTVDEPRPFSLTQPIPLGASITIKSIADGRTLAERNGALVAVDAQDPVVGTTATSFKVVDRQTGCVALQSESSGQWITVRGLGAESRVTLVPFDATSDAQTFLWTEMPRGELALLSLVSHRYLRLDGDHVTADAPGVQPDRKNGASLEWTIAGE